MVHLIVVPPGAFGSPHKIMVAEFVWDEMVGVHLVATHPPKSFIQEPA